MRWIQVVSSKKKWDPNPWAICHTSVDKDKDPEKFEKCVQKIKKKQTTKAEEKEASHRARSRPPLKVDELETYQLSLPEIEERQKIERRKIKEEQQEDWDSIRSKMRALKKHELGLPVSSKEDADIVTSKSERKLICWVRNKG